MSFRRSRFTALAAAAGLVTLPLGAQTASNPRPLDRTNMDTTCAACTDFFQFANGGWLKTAQIPAAYPRWGSFEMLADKNQLVLRQIVEESAAQKPVAVADRKGAAANVQKIGAFYRSCMDSATAERLGIDPVRPLLTRIDAIKTTDDVKRSLASLEADAGLAPFGSGAGPDAKNSKALIVIATQGGLGLPDRDVYLVDNPRFKQFRDAYVQHMVNLFTMAGMPVADAQADAQKVLALETKLAAAQMSRVQMRDPNAVYHKTTLAEFQKTTPNIDWAAFFKAQSAPAFTDINVMTPDYFKAVDSLLVKEPADAWRAYFRAHALHGAAGLLSAAFVNENFKFGQLFSGAKEMQPRWKRCTSATSAALSDPVGQEYVRRTFTEQDKARANAIVNNLRAALKERIEGLTWMSDATKRQALTKLAAFTQKIGYPDKWKDYSDLQIADGSYYANLQRVQEWGRARSWAKLNKPIDRTEWLMIPSEVNAYYRPDWNEIVFPAGILQFPFFNPQADDAVNYGAMGAVIGHEMSHGFDDQGRQFDAEGNLRDWWTADDAAKYKTQAQRVVEQFDGYTVVDSATHVKGQLTLGENIGDLGGLTIAYAAMEKALGNKPRTKIDGFTPEQRFFLGWAQVWRETMRPEAARNLVLTNVHSPGVWRVNGPLSNMPEFKAAWGCKDGDAMVRPAEKRAQIW
ncbi:peptidase M13 [Gemmatirosa kalamazoonensis]|uniref:Peptidase M13 n=1 Tax=Gemmatirosa kalamazoonensis TaxID=861299 RepID=W0RBA3_9BACT|nr:M13 family metallopeptidase [Gemmatirosa kalamazoonensis]AHG87717.1 peptidase M13 [Gemmatirosa kalamazoonensis]